MSTAQTKTFHFVAIAHDYTGWYGYRRLASFCCGSLFDAAVVVFTSLRKRSTFAVVLRDGSTGKRYSMGELAGLIPGMPWYWWTDIETAQKWAQKAVQA